MKTLYKHMTDAWHHEQRKHGLVESFAEDNINAMTQYEFLKAISDGLERLTYQSQQPTRSWHEL